MDTVPSHVNPVRNSPLISIVTVSLNAASTIEDTLASVYMQRPGFPIEQFSQLSQSVRPDRCSALFEFDVCLGSAYLVVCCIRSRRSPSWSEDHAAHVRVARFRFLADKQPLMKYQQANADQRGFHAEAHCNVAGILDRGSDLFVSEFAKGDNVPPSYCARFSDGVRTT